MKYNLFYQSKGGTPSKVEAWSRYDDPIPQDGQPHGNSRRHGDASPAVQERVINTIIAEGLKQGLSKDDIAHVLAIARIESGFNPDAAAGQSSASGVGQFIAKTGASYGLNDANRFDLATNTRALVEHYRDNKALAMEKGQDAAWVYKYHHDGPKLNSGGLGLAQKEVLPYARAYTASPLLANLGPNAQGNAADVKQPYPDNFVADVKQQAQAFSQAFKEVVGGGMYIGSWAAATEDGTWSARLAAVRSADERNSVALIAAEQRAASGPSPVAVTAEAEAAPVQVAAAAQAPSEVAPAGNRLPEATVAVLDKVELPAAAQPETYGVSPSSTTISLAQALADHMTEKGFDAQSVAQAPALALQVLEGSVIKETEGSTLVLHKEGEALASVTTKPDAEVFAKAGDSVLVLENLERIALTGLDTDAVAAIRGLAPNQTEPHSDLEVHQAAPAGLYTKALDPEAPLNSKGAVQELVAGLDALTPREAPQDSRVAEAKEAQATAEMSMSV